MRIPFIIAAHGNRPLTDLQIRRRGMLLSKSRTYRQCRARMLRKAKRRGDQWIQSPSRGPFFKFLFPASHPRFAPVEGEPSFGSCNVPAEQRLVEMDTWMRGRKASRRGVRSEAEG